MVTPNNPALFPFFTSREKVVGSWITRENVALPFLATIPFSPLKEKKGQWRTSVIIKYYRISVKEGKERNEKCVGKVKLETGIGFSEDFVPKK